MACVPAGGGAEQRDGSAVGMEGGHFFDQSIKDSIPNGIEHIFFGRSFGHPIASFNWASFFLNVTNKEIYIPETVKSIKLPKSYNQIIPSELQSKVIKY